MILLAGDVGGTNTRLLLAEYNGEVTNLLFEKDYASAEFSEFHELLNRFLEEANSSYSINAACFGVAGPVSNNEASVTNLPWIIKAQSIIDILHIPNVTLINDFVAVSYGVAMLESTDVEVIQHGACSEKMNNHPTSAIVGAGTGLGVACRTWVNDHYHIIPSETGHTNFSPNTLLQTELLSWLLQTHSQVSVESLLSGRGFETLYTFLRDVKKVPESSLIRESMHTANSAKVITDSALLHDDDLCVKTVELFVQIYGSTAGNVALNYYPVDEVLIAGGIAPKIKDLIHSSLFIDAFNQKGPMSSNMQKIAIKLITQDRLGLHGALYTMY
jgi:glucokinase